MAAIKSKNSYLRLRLANKHLPFAYRDGIEKTSTALTAELKTVADLIHTGDATKLDGFFVSPVWIRQKTNTLRTRTTMPSGVATWWTWADMSTPVLAESVCDIDADPVSLRESVRPEVCRFPALIPNWPSIDLMEYAHNVNTWDCLVFVRCPCNVLCVIMPP